MILSLIFSGLPRGYMNIQKNMEDPRFRIIHRNEVLLSFTSPNKSTFLEDQNISCIQTFLTSFNSWLSEKQTRPCSTRELLESALSVIGDILYSIYEDKWTSLEREEIFGVFSSSMGLSSGGVDEDLITNVSETKIFKDLLSIMNEQVDKHPWIKLLPQTDSSNKEQSSRTVDLHLMKRIFTTIRVKRQSNAKSSLSNLSFAYQNTLCVSLLLFSITYEEYNDSSTAGYMLDKLINDDQNNLSSDILLTLRYQCKFVENMMAHYSHPDTNSVLLTVKT